MLEITEKGVTQTVWVPRIIMVFALISGCASIESITRGLEGQELSESKIIQGLKEALEISTSNAVNAVSKLDGYYGNPNIRIPLPDAVQKVENVLRVVGYGGQLDAFELSMNRAAEQATPEAKSLFLEAIRQMTFSDARKILQGREDEATLYFKEKTYNKLHQISRPIIHAAMSKVGVTRRYRELDDKLRRMPFVDRWSFDLDEYVTDKTLDGLFIKVAEEERKIRQDPGARVTELLKEVFGS